MALRKDIEINDIVVLNYHRVASVTNVTNQMSIITVASYVNEEKRMKEKQWYENDCQGDMNVFIMNRSYSKEYDKNLNVDGAYEYLKTLEEFEGTEDILEETVEETVEPEETVEEIVETKDK